jgi:branched-chain amino acid transport system permease protein
VSHERSPRPASAARAVGHSLTRRGRWNVLEILFWLAAAATLFLMPERHLILNEIAIIGLFALSLDLILGYAGIVSLGHAAFFGLGAYGAGLLAKNGLGDPLLGLASRPWRRRSSAS